MVVAGKRKSPGSDTSEISQLLSLNLMDGAMDMSRTKQCLILLRKLMCHEFGRLFNQPVDPVKLNIPDYFSIIKNPMDLGTIRENLVKGKYASTQQFSSDVKLTFSNAMLYNPSTNIVHIMAKKLSVVFAGRWRLLEQEWANEIPKPNRHIEPSKKVRILVQGSAGVSCKGPFGANKDKCSGREALSHNLTLSKKEATVAHEKLRGAAVPENDENSALERACGVHQHQPLPSTSSSAASEKEFDQFLLEEPLSPSRALRVAMMKCRFADTIMKAQKGILQDQVNTVDSVKLQLEREKLERRQSEEKGRIEAWIRDKQASTQIKIEKAQKLKIAKEREAARLALQQMKKTVDLDNSELPKEFEKLNLRWSSCGIEADNPLEKLGLFLKEEQIGDEDSGIPHADSGIPPILSWKKWRSANEWANEIPKSNWHIEPSKKVRILGQGSAGVSCKGPFRANNNKCSGREALSHNLTLSKKEATIAHEKLRGVAVPENDRNSALERACGVHQHQPFPSTSSSATPEKEYDQFLSEEPLSPSRALRAAMLKCRFADTIVKAQQGILLDQVKKVDSVKLQLEREKLERRQSEEKGRIEVQIRAKQAATQIKVEEAQKLKIVKDREAARLALQQMKKTVDLDNSELPKEFEKLNLRWSSCGIEADNPLEKLGLFLKEDHIGDEDLGIPHADSGIPPILRWKKWRSANKF